MDDRTYNIRYLRTCIRQQLAGKGYFGNQPFMAEYAGEYDRGHMLIRVTDTLTGASVLVRDTAEGHRAAILQLLGESPDYPHNRIYRRHDHE